MQTEPRIRLSCAGTKDQSEEVRTMLFDFNNKKNRKIVSTVIVILLVLSMVAPVVLGALLR